MDRGDRLLSATRQNQADPQRPCAGGRAAIPQGGALGQETRPRFWAKRGWRILSGQMRIREEGVALISVVVVIAVIAVATADFAYNTQVDLASAANARDDLRGHYLARSAINLSKLLLKVQQKIIDPNQKYLGGMDLQIADFAPVILSAFNSREGAEMLGSFLGVQSGEIRGLGVDVGTFDLQMESLDGKLNVNCGGGVNPGSPAVTRFAASMAALMMPARYNRLFEEPDENGQYADRLEVLRAIIDWADQDTVIYGATAPEDYGYNQRKDPYEIKNQYYDTVQELRLVKGVDDEFMAAFSDSLTVYGDCKVNLNLADAPLLAALIIQNAATPNDPALLWENLSLLTRYVVHIRSLSGGFKDVATFVQAVESPMEAAVVASSFDPTGMGSSGVNSGLPPVTGIKLDAKTLGEAVVVGGSRRIWRLIASAEVGRVKKKIIAVWDTKYVSMNASRHNMGPGGYLYWREE